MGRFFCGDPVMDRTMILEHLAQAEAHIALGREHIDKQHRIIAQLYSQGADMTIANELLAHLEESQGLHEASLVRIREELRVADAAYDASAVSDQTSDP